jgi:type I restriction enzyme, S subunit
MDEETLATGWKTTTIGSVCEVNPPKPNLRGVSDETPVLFVPMAAVDEVSGRITAAHDRELGQVRNKSYRTFTSGDVLFAKITPCMENGKAAVVPCIPSGLGFGSTEFHVLRPGPDIDADYLWHFVRQESFRREAEQNMTGSVGQARVPKDFVEQYTIPLPPLDVQRNLVKVLELATRKGSSAIAHVVAGRRVVERFRRSILAAACSGRLTADWRSDNPPSDHAASLVAKIDEVRRVRLGRRYRAPRPLEDLADLPEGWCWTTIGSLVEVATGATPLRRRADYYNGTIPWVTSGAVNAGLITTATEYITETAIRETNAKVFPSGTLLVAMYGEGQTRGRVAELSIEAATNQAVAALLFDKDTEYLRPYLKIFCLENYERIRSFSFGGVQPNLSLGAIRDTVLPLPPRSEQSEVVRQVDSLLALAAEIGSRVDASSRQIERSSRTIVAKAFAGELTIGLNREIASPPE